MINPHYAKLNIMKVELDTKFQGKSKKKNWSAQKGDPGKNATREKNG